MIELDNTILLFIGSENYSGKKIPWTEMSVRVRFPPEAQKISLSSSCGEVANAAVCKTVIRGFESHHEV